MIRGMIKVSLIVVFLGITMIWFMTPSRIHREDWVPKIKAKANTTYFGTQGATIVEYTVPMLLFAVFGCVYLHLGKKGEEDCTERSTDEKSGPSPWKRLVFVKGPLGVVSWIELTILTMFLALLIWSFAMLLHIYYSAITQETAKAKGVEVWENKLQSAGLRLGIVGNIGFAFLFFPVTRTSSVLSLLGLTSESSIKYHIWLGHIVLTLFTGHSLCYLVYWALTDQLPEILEWKKYGISNVAGELSFLAGLAMWATTFPKIRRKMFELFFYTHYLYILFVIFFIFHVGIAYSCMMLPNLYLFLIDRYLRFLQSRQNVRLLSSRILPCEALELNFSKSPGLIYSSTSVMFINIPSISKLQWHPFTVTSNSKLEPETLSIVIKKEGSWTKQLYQILSAPSSVERLEVAIEGPYGPSSTHFLRHETLVMVSGGSGITPFFCIIREIIFMSTAMNRKMPQILLVCAFKSTADFTMLDLLLPISGIPSDISHVNLQIEAYITREKTPVMSTDNKNLTRTVRFKPNPSDQSISAILGPNSWLWLGAIISSSFLIYLTLMGIIGRYYIYPIEQTTAMTVGEHAHHGHGSMRKMFPTASEGAMCMLLICVCIALTCSAAVFRNKNRNAMEAKKIQTTDVDTPTTSPGSLFHNGDRELESLPNESFLQARTMHYGSRPELKKILLGCEGSSVGVFVSGPKQMRHDVATICSSGLAENLHFESISFSW